jgi:hypothetical protein
MFLQIVEIGVQSEQAKTARIGTIIWKLEGAGWAEQAPKQRPVPDIPAYINP